MIVELAVIRTHGTLCQSINCIIVVEESNQPANVRSANRNRNAPANRNTNYGFRPSSTWQQDPHPVPPEFESERRSRSVQPSPGRRPVLVRGATGWPNGAVARRVW